MTYIDFLWGFYFVPTVIAWLRNHPQAPLITAINIGAGWTLIGWVATLVWALRTPERPVKPAPVATPHDRGSVGELAGALLVWAGIGVIAFFLAFSLAAAGGGASSPGVASLAILWVFGWPAALITLVKIAQRWSHGDSPYLWKSTSPATPVGAGFCPRCGYPRTVDGPFCAGCGWHFAESGHITTTAVAP